MGNQIYLTCSKQNQKSDIFLARKSTFITVKGGLINSLNDSYDNDDYNDDDDDDDDDDRDDDDDDDGE